MRGMTMPSFAKLDLSPGQPVGDPAVAIKVSPSLPLVCCVCFLCFVVCVLQSSIRFSGNDEAAYNKYLDIANRDRELDEHEQWSTERYLAR